MRDPRIRLTLEERTFLYYKYVNSGMDPIGAKKKVKKIRDYIDNLLCKMKVKGKTPEQINEKFKQEFAKICRESKKRGRKAK